MRMICGGAKTARYYYVLVVTLSIYDMCFYPLPTTHYPKPHVRLQANTIHHSTCTKLAHQKEAQRPLPPRRLRSPRHPLTPHHLPVQIPKEPRRLPDRKDDGDGRGAEDPAERDDHPGDEEPLREDVVGEEHGYR